ncbi:MAG: hypothetical protein ACBZ72_00645 [Candidatus Bathyarchaeia archaeon]|jgi:hypothetical protein
MLAARDDLADRIGKMAEKRGFTLFGMVNDLLDLAIKADNMGISLKEAVDSFELAKEVRDASFTLVLESLLYDTAEIAFRSEKEKTLQTWFDAGVWIAQRYIARGVEDPLGAYERELKVFGWNIPGVTMERSDKEVSFRILSPRFSETYTLLFNHYLQGIIDGSGYTVTFNEVGRGNIRLEAVKREDNGGHR